MTEPITQTGIFYHKRGPFGSGAFHGVTNSFLVADFLDTFRPDSVLDPMCGSGTVVEAAIENEIPVVIGADLNPDASVWPEKIRDHIMSNFDLMSFNYRKDLGDMIMEATDGKGIEFIWWDPPYYDMASYSKDPRDFCRGTYNDFLKRMQSSMEYLGSLLAIRGVILLELGDLRRPGQRPYFINDDVCYSPNVGKARLTKEVRVVNVFTPVIRNVEGYSAYIDKLKVRQRETVIEINHEYITVLRSTSSGPTYR